MTLNTAPSERLALIGRIAPISQTVAVNTGLVPIKAFFRLLAVVDVGVIASTGVVNAKVQAAVGPGVLLEQLPGAEKVQPGAETGFTDHQLLTRRQFGKAPGQVVLQQEGMASFGQAAVVGEIHIGKLA